MTLNEDTKSDLNICQTENLKQQKKPKKKAQREQKLPGHRT